MPSRILPAMALLLLAVFLCPAPAYAISVTPAAFDRMEISVPAETQAGEPIVVTLRVLDRFGNPMPAGWKPSVTFVLSSVPDIDSLSRTLTPEAVATGTIKLVPTRAGSFTLRVSVSDGTSRQLASAALQVRPGRPEKLQVKAPPAARTSESTYVQVAAVDRFGNVVADWSPGKEGFVPEGAGLPTGKVKRVDEGRYQVEVRFHNIGRVKVSLTDQATGLKGSSEPVEIRSGALARFQVEAQAEVVSGTALALKITALDENGNPVLDYTNFKGVRLSAEGAEVIPDLVPPSVFNGGVAQASAMIRRAGNYTLKVTELQGIASGSAPVRILPGSLALFQVGTPETATAGEPFEVTLRGFDAQGNAVATLPAGSSIVLSTDGTGRLVPDMVPASSYSRGEARVKIVYEKAESFQIQASLASGGRMMTTPPKLAPAPSARDEALRAKEDAERARRAARLQQKQIDSTLSPEKKAAAAKPSPGTQAQPGKPPVPPAPVGPVPSSDALRASLSRPGSLDRITVVESPRKALVTFSTNGLVDYSVTSSTKMSRKWLEVDFPTLRADVAGRIEGGKSVVGEVYIEQGEGGMGAKVFVEVLPSRLNYDLYQEGNTLVLRVQEQ